MKLSLMMLIALFFAGSVTLMPLTAVAEHEEEAGCVYDEEEEMWICDDVVELVLLQRRGTVRTAIRNVNNMAQQMNNFFTSHQNGSAPVYAGDLMNNIRWDLNYSTADTDDRDLGDDGDIDTIVLSVSGEYTKNSDATDFSIGYETTGGYDDYEEHRVNFGISYRW